VNKQFTDRESHSVWLERGCLLLEQNTSALFLLCKMSYSKEPVFAQVSFLIAFNCNF
jgi:hypothetical protein